MRAKGFAVLMLIALLSACGGGGGDGESLASTEIRSFAVTGTNGAVSGSGQSVVIDPSQNSGQFRVQWDTASSTSPYRADIYISADSVFSTSDQQFFGRNCDQSLGDCPNQAASYYCTFSADVKIACASDAATNLSTWFASAGGLPHGYYLILRVCDGQFTDCVTKALPVTFQ